MPSLNTLRTITVRQISEGADKVRSDLDGLAQAQQRVAQASDATARATETSSRRQLSAASAYDRVRASVDASFKAQQQFDRASKTTERAFSQGLIDEQERARTLDMARQRFHPTGATGLNDNDPSRRGLSSYDKSFIKYQGFDVASSLGSGASPLTVAFQQGPQVLQQLADREGGLGAGLKQLGASALALVTPFTVATGVVAGLGVAAGVAASQAAKDRDVLEKATRGIGAATGATASQLDAIAKGNAEAGKVSTSTAREIVAGYASLGTIGIPVLGDLTRVTSEYARITGQDTVAATAELGRAFSDVASGADAIGSKLGGLSDATRQLIQTQIEQGDRTAAQQTLADALKASIDANAASTTGWAAAWNTATIAANGYWEAAKRIAGIRLGVAPEGAQDAVTRLTAEIDSANRLRKAFGQDPLDASNSEKVRQRSAAEVVADQERRIAEGRAAEERANQASDAAGRISRSYDPNLARLTELRTQQSQLRDALADPLARSKLSDFDSTESAYNAATRAIDTLTDSTGKLIDRQEMARRGDQLRLDALKATTDAEKAAVAERQKSFDLIGKTVTNSDARGQIDMARQLSLASSSDKSKGGSDSDAKDEFDRATKSVEDRIRRQDQDTQTHGMAAEAVARYRTETDLLTAAKRAERDITPELTAQIKDYADRAGEAAKRQEEMRQSIEGMDSLRSGGHEVFSGLYRDISKGTSAANTLSNAIGRITDRLGDLAANNLADLFFGRRGSSDAGLLGSLTGGRSGSGGGGFFSSLFGGSSGPSSASTPGLSDFFGGNFFPSFATGGFTGAGGRHDPAGVVHRGEYVFDQSSVARIGVRALDAMRANLPSFAAGGLVSDLLGSPGAEVGAEGSFGEVLT